MKDKSLHSVTDISTGQCGISPSCLLNTVSPSGGLQVNLNTRIDLRFFSDREYYPKCCPSSSVGDPTSTVTRPAIGSNSCVSCSKCLVNSPKYNVLRLKGKFSVSIPSISDDSEVAVTSLFASELRTALVTPLMKMAPYESNSRFKNNITSEWKSQYS